MEQPIQIPHLKPNAVVSTSIGSLHISQLQALGVHLATPELKQKLESKQKLEPWENGVVSLVTLLQELYNTAKTQDMLEFKSVEDIIGGHLRG